MDERDPRWTFERLSEASGLSVSVLSRLSAGKQRFHQGHVEALVRALDVEPADLFEGAHTDPQKREILALLDNLTPDFQEIASDQLRALASRAKEQQERA